MEVITRYVRELTEEDRSALERVVGHALDESGQVTIQVLGSPGTATTNGKSATEEGLPSWCNIYEDLTAEQVDDLNQSIARIYGSRDVE
jgi:hypothetical protein